MKVFKNNFFIIWFIFFTLDPPIYASGVHFYQSDPSLFEAVDGLDPPNKEKHATLISVEPVCYSLVVIIMIIIITSYV